MNPQELYEAYMSVYESDDRREMRRLASQERQAEKKAESEFRSKSGIGAKKKGPKLSATKMSKGEGENYAKQTMKDAEHIAKKAKGHTVGNPFPEEFDVFDQVLSELIDAGYTAEEALEYMVQEAEGSYGQTPTARQKMGALTNKRRNTPASEYPQRGAKKTAVKSAEKHLNRMGNPDAGDRSKKSTKPDWGSGKRKGMTQSDRDHARGEAEYGHTGYDPDFDGGPSAPGGMPKGKKLTRQKKTGVSAENYNIHDISIDEAQYARNNPEKYEREQERSQSSRQRRMNDPKTGINSKAFNDFYNAQMASKKKKPSN